MRATVLPIVGTSAVKVCDHSRVTFKYQYINQYMSSTIAQDAYHLEATRICSLPMLSTSSFAYLAIGYRTPDNTTLWPALSLPFPVVYTQC